MRDSLWASSSRQAHSLRGERLHASQVNLHIPDFARGRGSGFTVVFHGREVPFDRLPHHLIHLGDRGPRCNAPRQVGHVGTVVRLALLNDDGIPHSSVSPFSAACFRMLLSVPGLTSSDGLPGTVTVPDLVGWWKW